MQLNVLNNYLQNQPLNTGATSESAAVQGVSGEQSGQSHAGPDDYSPSRRAILLSAVAQEFDVQALSAEEFEPLQRRLQEYTLVNSNDLNAFSLIHNAKPALGERQTLDAVALLEQASNRFDSEQIGYQQRRQISRVHTLMQNLASARPLYSQAS